MNTPAIPDTRRPPEQVIAELQSQIAAIKSGAAQKKIVSTSASRHARAALKSIDKASAVFEDVASLKLLGEARAALAAWLARPSVVAPKSDDVVASAPVATILAVADNVAKSLESPLQTRIESFAVDLTDLIKRSMIDAVERVLEPESVASAATEARPETLIETSIEPVSLALYEKQALIRALTESGGDRLAAAKLLQVGKSTLYRMVRKHGIK